MASPFAIFRKHQKVMIAVLAVLAMFAFVFLPITLQQLSLRSSKNPVVVETSKFGDLHALDIEYLGRRRQAVLNFLRYVSDAVIRNGGTGFVAQREIEQFGDEPLSEQSLVATWLYAQSAKDLGLVVSEETINEYIKEVSEGRLKSSDFTKRKGSELESPGILVQMRVTQRQLFGLLRQELLARKLVELFTVSTVATTPAQRWDYYTRLKRKATIEVLPVSVSNYVDKVKDPSEDELKEFFEKHKDMQAYPASPEPGFRKPPRVSVQYFRADYADFMGPDVLTEDEVKDCYMQNGDFFDQAAGAGREPTDQQEDQEPVEGAPKQKSPDDEKSVDTAEEKPAEPADKESAEPAEGKPAEAAQKQPVDTDDKGPNAEEEPKQKASNPERADTTGENSDDTSSVAAGTPVILASLRGDQANPQQPAAGPEPPADAPRQPPAEPAEPEPGKSPTGPELPGAATETPTDQTSPAPADTPSEKPTQEAEEPPAHPPLRTPAEVEKILQGPVGTLVRRTLAGQKIEEVFTPLHLQMSQYYGKLNRYESDLEAAKEEGLTPSAKPPKRPDFAALAESKRLAVVTTPMMSQQEFYESEQYAIGRSLVESESFLTYAFESSREEYQPAESKHLDENYQPDKGFLFWIVERTKERPKEPEEGEDRSLWHGVPEFEDKGVRDDVLRSYKMVQARKLAADQAERFAKQAREEGKPLEKVFAGRDVTVARPFTWMSSAASAQISAVDGVDMPGIEFMRAVFDLEKGGVAVAMNQPKTVAYVIRMVDVSPSRRVSQILFEKEPYYKYARVSNGDRGQMLKDWHGELEHRAGLKWIRKPNQQNVE